MSREGIHTSERKIKAITSVPPPADASKLRSFLGMVNHYGKFVKNLTDLSAPLNKLLRKEEPWSWTNECQTSFLKVKNALTSTDVLAHYDPKLPLGLACDTSSVGVGAVLFHKYSDGSEQPIAYASKSLTSAEKNYSQIEREALSIIFGVRKFHRFLYGRSFLLLTDHKPLLTVFPQWLLADSRDGQLYYQHIPIQLLTNLPKSMVMLIVFLDFHKKLTLNLKISMLMSPLLT